ncbi:uncharacterized protein RJT20DRAFT_5767 [Scheffersomyces xylosifermentans]|uniref:uncharacterized protein n=1 Tax=Scheffersomyces xylosifermentans TaxID=1304137 RepID=UPI00315D3881
MIVICVILLVATKSSRKLLSRGGKLSFKNVILSILFMGLFIVTTYSWYYVASDFLPQYINSYPFQLDDELKTFNRVSSPIAKSISNMEYKPFKIPAYSLLEKHRIVQAENQPCSSIEITDNDSVAASIPFNVNFKGETRMIRKQAIKMLREKQYSPIRKCFKDDQTEQIGDIVTSKWYKYNGASVWMDKYEVHFLVSRVVYSKAQLSHYPTISILYAQIFDRDWKELTDYKFPSTNMSFPSILPVQLDIPVGSDWFLGAEDPRAIVRDYFNVETQQMDQEPIVIYNTKVQEIEYRRAMHFYRPLRKPEESTRLIIKDMPPRYSEKNWAPFIDKDSENHINFIYNFVPLRVLKCAIETGACELVSGPKFQPKSQQIGSLRGGTNLVPIPANLLPEKIGKSRKYWFGIARSMNRKCGCFRTIYRPHAYLISRDIEEEDSYTLDYVSSLLDFNVDPRAWNKDKQDQKCGDRKSVYIPNSIDSWDFTLITDLADSEGGGEMEDILSMTFSEADITNSIIYLKGFLIHLLRFLDGNYRTIKKHYQETEYNLIVTEFLGKCSTSLSQQYCEFTCNRRCGKTELTS